MSDFKSTVHLSGSQIIALLGSCCWMVVGLSYGYNIEYYTTFLGDSDNEHLFLMF